MTAQEIIRFGHLRELIDSGNKLTEDEQIEYYTLLKLVKSDLPHEPTQVMDQLVRAQQFKSLAKRALEVGVPFMLRILKMALPH